MNKLAIAIICFLIILEVKSQKQNAQPPISQKSVPKTSNSAETSMAKNNTAACQKMTQQLLLSTNIHNLTRSPTDKVNDLVCKGISDETCCDKNMFKNQNRLYNDYSKPKRTDFPLGNLISSIKEVMNDGYDWVVKLAQYQSSHLYKEKIHGHYYTNIISIAKKEYKIEDFVHNWAPEALKCQTYMGDMTRGTLCSICDDNEYIRFQESTTQFISQADARNFSEKCTNYLVKTYDLIEFFTKYSSVLYIKYNIESFSKKNVEISSFLPDKQEFNKVILAMKSCKDKTEKCQDPLVLKYFMMGHVTLLDYKNLNFVSTLNYYSKYWGPQSKIVLNNADEYKKKIIFNYKETHDEVKSQEKNLISFDAEGKGAFQLLDKDFPVDSIEFQINKSLVRDVTSLDQNSKFFTYPFSDNNIFHYDKHCPLALKFGGQRTYNRINTDKSFYMKYCKNLERSCCTIETFTIFAEYQWNFAQYRLSSIIQTKLKINEYQLNKLWKIDEKDPSKSHFFQYFDEANGIVPEGCRGIELQAKCKSYYQTIHDSIQHIKFNNYWGQYQEDTEKCHTALEEIRADLRCASCDEDNNKSFDISDRTISVNGDMIRHVVKSCYNADLFEVNLLRRVYLAYFMYAREIKPTVDLDSEMLYKIFPNKLQKCSEWIMMSDANNNKDLSQGRECQAYALEKLENLLEDPMQMKMNMSLSRFVKTILKILLNRDYLPEALTELFPESVEPHYADKMPSETDTWKRDFNNDQTGYRWRFLVSQTESTGLNHLLVIFFWLINFREMQGIRDWVMTIISRKWIQRL